MATASHRQNIGIGVVWNNLFPFLYTSFQISNSLEYLTKAHEDASFQRLSCLC